ncbi:hypothetical protein [endosymbiont of Pachyrhynchus infernalis]|uniref:hypothetical protein n=1 Tax=endosymbiont of Pachyrhynchus infernalis TaxID=1971488 RepID=UPI000DC718A8|nr:hypothetical protein [endosymbiont of Pachyrhynchus infernalis]BBA84918.1 21 kDa hemolysin [endosymbiont of Pachyrhynchus infernalis]
MLNIFNKNINKFTLILISAFLTKIISDPRNINIQIIDVINKFKIKNFIKKNINKNNIKIISYNNNIILIGKLDSLNEINKLNKIINNYKYNKIKIFNKIKINNNKIKKQYFLKYFYENIKLYLILLKFNTTKLSNIKFFIVNDEIYIIGICNRKDTINLIRLINYYFKNKEIITAIIHKDFLIKK